MLATKYRVPIQRIDYILKKGESLNSKLFIVLSKDNREQFCRYRVIISRKIDLKAVKRNKLRRQVYEAIRTNSSIDNAAKNGRDIILIAKKQTINSAYKELEKDLTNIINNFHGKI